MYPPFHVTFKGQFSKEFIITKEDKRNEGNILTSLVTVWAMPNRSYQVGKLMSGYLCMLFAMSSMVPQAVIWARLVPAPAKSVATALCPPCPTTSVLAVDHMSIGARIEYPSVAELVDILFHAHCCVEVALWLQIVVMYDCCRFDLIIVVVLNM